MVRVACSHSVWDHIFKHGSFTSAGILYEYFIKAIAKSSESSECFLKWVNVIV